MTSDDQAKPTRDELLREADVKDIEVLRALKRIAIEAQRSRRKHTAVILCVISGVFLIRQVLPPAWMVWLPL